MLVQLTKKLLEKTDGRDRNQYLAVFSASISFFLAGVHFGWTIPSLPKLLTDEDLNISDNEGSYIAMISSVGQVIGGFLGSYLIDKIGRKYAILSIAVPQFCGFLLTYLSKFGKYWLYAARILGGIGENAAIAVVPTYVSEVTDPELRGTCGTLIGFAYPIGTLSITLIGSYVDIPTTALICLFFPVLFFLMFSLMPETPYYLLMKSRTKEAENSLKILRRSAKVEKELLSLTIDVDRQMSEKGTYKDLFLIPTNRKALLLAICARFFQQFTGSAAVNSYCQLLITQTTDFSAVTGSIILQSLGIIVVVPTYFLIDRLGRRVLIRTGVCSIFVIHFCLGTFFLLKDQFGVDTTGLDWIPLILIAAFIICFGFGVGVVVVIFISEIFSSSIKSKALGLTSVVFAGSIMGSIKLYQFTADSFSKAVPFYTFATTTLCFIIFSFKCLPETRGKTLEMIQMELKKEESVL